MKAILLPVALFLGLSAGAVGFACAASAQEGGASWYASGRQTANGERFRPDGITAAHRHLRFGTRVRVTDRATGRQVTVRINDRGPFVGGRIIDLSRGAARHLGILGRGTARVHLRVLD